MSGTRQFFAYFTGLLENPERSGTHTFDQWRFATAAKECLQLCLGNHHSFSKGARESAHHDNALCQNQPWLWIGWLGVHSRIQKGRHNLEVQQCKSFLKNDIIIKDLSLPQVILVESMWIHRFHRCSTDSTVNPWYFFWQWRHLNSVFSVHGLSTDNPHNTMIFLIFMESIWIVHWLHIDWVLRFHEPFHMDSIESLGI